MSLEAWGDKGPDYSWTEDAVEEAIQEAQKNFLEKIGEYFYRNVSYNLRRDLIRVLQRCEQQELKDLLAVIEKEYK